MSMTTNKQALRLLAESVEREEWQARKEPGIGGEHTVIVKGSLVKHSGWSTHRPIADQVVDKKTSKFIAAANPSTVLALLDELEAAEKRIAELEARTSALPQLNDDLIAILGRPNFTCAHLAELMRKSGEDIPRKSENEQAAVIHWFLGLYLDHGDKWESVAKADIQARVAAAGITTKGE